MLSVDYFSKGKDRKEKKILTEPCTLLNLDDNPQH
jgi:hypothetical protein